MRPVSQISAMAGSETSMISCETQSEAVYTEYRPKILRYIKSKVSNPADAEELTQQVFLKMLERWDSYDREREIGVWVYAIARNTVIDFYRTRHEHIDIEEVPELPSEEEGLLETVLRDEQRETLARALRALPERERDLIILHYFDGRSLAEIAQAMDLPYGRIKRLHAKALAELETLMRPQG